MARAGLITALLLVEIVSILFFLQLLNILYQYDDPVWRGLTEGASQNAWIAICMSVMVLLLLVTIALVAASGGRSGGTSYERVPRRDVPDYARDARPGTVYLECRRCTTVFGRLPLHLGEPGDPLDCPHCGREGRVPDVGGAAWDDVSGPGPARRPTSA